MGIPPTGRGAGGGRGRLSLHQPDALRRSPEGVAPYGERYLTPAESIHSLGSPAGFVWRSSFALIFMPTAAAAQLSDVGARASAVANDRLRHMLIGYVRIRRYP